MTTPLDRRRFIQGLSAVAATSLLNVKGEAATLPVPSAAKLPRWRGFNLLEKFIASHQNTAFREADFAWMAEWGFNFVRLPMSYHCWSDPKDWHTIREPVMKEIDEAVAFGQQYGIHVSLNFHRAPGYSVDRSQKEPFNLWTDETALEACVYHWRHFAARYKHLPNAALSFDLINEPGMKNEQDLLDDAAYFRVAKALVAGIRAESPGRLIIADGLNWGRIPVPALAELGIAQSTRGYDPMPVSHWQAEWVEGSDQWARPTWPLPATPARIVSDQQQLARFRQAFKDNPIVQHFVADESLTQDWNRVRVERQLIRPWKDLEALGVGVHVGEFGAHNHTPHEVVLGWLRDLTGCWREAGWGWALWNLRGSFGVLDSQRTDIEYEGFRGHQLDRAMLELLRNS